MSVAETMRRKLESALTPIVIEIEDQSHLHKGHAGYRPGGESHFHVRVVASGFAGKSRIERQRMVMTALKDEMGHPIHALGIRALTPEEAAAETD